MDIKKAMDAAAKVLPYNQLSVKQTYLLSRKLDHLGRLHLLRPTFHATDIKIDLQNRKIPARIFHPQHITKPKHLILFFHGGGWVRGNLESYNRICASIVHHTGHCVISVDYRLAPEHRFPAGLNDCYEVSHYIFTNCGKRFGLSSNKITLMGDSAGGNLAASVSLMARDRNEFFPKQQILIYPATYFKHDENSPYPSVKQNGTNYILTSKHITEYMDLYKSSDEDLKNPYFAPLLTKDFSNQPRTLIITAQYDPLRDEGEDFGQRLRNAGNTVKIYRMMNAIHGFFSLPAGAAHVKESYKIINQFLNEV